jgi:hypothetical protein
MLSGKLREQEVPNMDPIAAALAVGAAAGLSGVASQAVADAYGALKSALRRLYPDVELAPLERRPDSAAKRASVAEDLEAAGADQDAQVLWLARKLIEAIVRDAPRAAASAGVDLEQVRAEFVRVQRVSGGVRLREVEATDGGIHISDVAGIGGPDPGLLRAADAAHSRPAVHHGHPTIDLDAVTAGRDLTINLEGASRPRETAAGALEPYVVARARWTGRTSPDLVVLENVGNRPALGCVYCALLTDSLGLRAWYMTAPGTLGSGELREMALGAPHGTEQSAYERIDDSDNILLWGAFHVPGLGHRQVRQVTLRAGDRDMDPGRYPGARVGVRETVGHPFPPASLFQSRGDGPGRSPTLAEAVVYLCTENHVHREILHRHRAPEVLDRRRVEPWMDWYVHVTRNELAPAVPSRRPAVVVAERYYFTWFREYL